MLIQGGEWSGKQKKKKNVKYQHFIKEMFTFFNLYILLGVLSIRKFW